MFSRKTAFLIGIVIFIATTFTILTVSSRSTLSENGVERIVISLISPFQMVVSASFAWCTDIWNIYFLTINAGEENRELKRELALTMALRNQCRELELENSRLREFIDFNNSSENVLIAAKVIGRDPSPWFQTLTINKGGGDGLVKGLPVLVSEGIVGQIVDVSEKSSRVLLITDRNSAVDALVQSSRARGIVQGNNTDQCLFEYALRKDAIMPGDIIISSGLDQVFPKGLRIGEVLDVNNENSDLFQMILIKTFVDFHKLEEVLVSTTTGFSVESSDSDLYVPEEEDASLNSPDNGAFYDDSVPDQKESVLNRDIRSTGAEENPVDLKRVSSQVKRESRIRSTEIYSDPYDISDRPESESYKQIKRSVKNASSKTVNSSKKETR